MEIMYVAINAVELKDSIALKAVVDPMLIKLIAMVKRQVKMTELTGTRHRGCTAPSQLEKGKPLSRANANVYEKSGLDLAQRTCSYLSRCTGCSTDSDHGEK